MLSSRMRIALLSDIHGNRWALDAVLEHIAGQGVDQTWNLGDILSGPLAPAATAERLMALALPTIRGNHERQLLACADAPGGPSDQFAYEHTEARHRDWLRGLPATAAPRADIAMCHGTLASDLEPLAETIVGDGQRGATLDELAARTAGCDARLIVCGHTHVPRLARTRDGRWIVNPGSVGLQAYDAAYPRDGAIATYYVDNGSPHASYAIVEERDHGWDVAFHRVAYDWEAAAACAEANGRREWAHALRSGFALRA